MEFRPVLQQCQLLQVLGTQHLGRVVPPDLLQFRSGEACPNILVKQMIPSLLAPALFHQRAIHRADVYPAAGPVELSRKTGVVRVQVGEEQVCPPQVHPQLPELVLHGLSAGVQTEARVDEQVPLSGEKIAVKVFQRVARQRDIQPVQPLCDLLCHGFPPCFYAVSKYIVAGFPFPVHRRRGRGKTCGRISCRTLVLFSLSESG